MTRPLAKLKVYDRKEYEEEESSLWVRKKSS